MRVELSHFPKLSIMKHVTGTKPFFYDKLQTEINYEIAVTLF